jgi:uncharacterized pyridoxal phosphate-dependent enzyme
MRNIHENLGTPRVINARGTFTPLGVSIAPEPVIEAVAESMRHFFVMSDLRRVVGERLAELTGVEFGAITHCTAASITMSVAAIMCGDDKARIAQLPNTDGMKSRFVIPAGHLVNYGHPIEQAIRLAGADVVIAGSEVECSDQDLCAALDENGVGGLVLVHSRMCQGSMVSIEQSIKYAQERNVPVILDAAAQDFLLPEMLSFGADLTLFSAQKYLSSVTAGMVLGHRDLVNAVSLQETGIGRGMKAGKEALVGAVVALQLRKNMKLPEWAEEQKKKSEYFAKYVSRLAPLTGEIVADPMGNPFYRVRVTIDPEACDKPASEIADQLTKMDPVLIVFDHNDQDNSLMFEIVQLDEQDIEVMVSLLAVVVFNRPESGMRRRNIED